MKSTFFSYLIAGSAMLFTACGDNSGTANNEAGTTAKDSTTISTTTTNSDDSDLMQEKPTFTNVDAKTAASMDEVVSHYLHVKNALANDNGSEAASGAKAMAASLDKIDHSALAGDQMKLYMDLAESLKEHAEHITANASKIDHQREHFIMMSKDVYDLVKGFGASKALYVDHCPMADNNKGANWLSDTKEITSNPYMGQKMPKCGTVEKVVKR
jgi:hypothetical protein